MNVTGKTGDKDRDVYSRFVQSVETRPGGLLTLLVTITLSCGHKVEGKAYARAKRIPARLFCKECHQKATT